MDSCSGGGLQSEILHSRQGCDGLRWPPAGDLLNTHSHVILTPLSAEKQKRALSSSGRSDRGVPKTGAAGPILFPSDSRLSLA